MEAISAPEFAEWIAYSSLEPFGPQVEQRRHAELRAHLTNLIPRKRGAKAVTAEDFLPKDDREPRDLIAYMRAQRDAGGSP